jgi:hypothetical protein
LDLAGSEIQSNARFMKLVGFSSVLFEAYIVANTLVFPSFQTYPVGGTYRTIHRYALDTMGRKRERKEVQEDELWGFVVAV